jgi:hypothetical protein
MNPIHSLKFYFFKVYSDRLWAGRPSSILGRRKRLSPLHSVQTGSVTLFNGCRGLFTRVKRGCSMKLTTSI